MGPGRCDSLASGRIKAGANVFHAAVKPQRILGCLDEAVPPVESGGIFVDGIHYNETCGSDLPSSDRFSQCLGEKHCANASSLL